MLLSTPPHDTTRHDPHTHTHPSAPTKHFMERGVCPYGDDCHFAHGHEQLRKFPTKMQQEAKRRMEEAKNAMKTGFSKADPPPAGFPLKIGEPFKLFILRDSTFQNLVVSVRDETWIAQVGH